MDEALLADKGIHPEESIAASVEGYRLIIGERATLIPNAGHRAYGVLMTLDAHDVDALYSDASVADYRPESVDIDLPDGRRSTAVTYLLPEHRVTGTNREYAKALHALASRLGFPDGYLSELNEML